MNSTNKILAVASAAFATQFAGAVPVVSSVDMNQSSKTVVITYTLLGEDAVVTLDVQTNANTSAAANDPGWTSIGGAAVSNAKGDVWKKVETGSRRITWRPDQSWPDHVIADGGARAVVTAWSLDNTPDYMAVDITTTGGAGRQTYYPAADFVPGGVSNSLYKTTTLLMRKIMAKDVTWTMGSVAEVGRESWREMTHQVTLANNYYIGVYPVTQTQWQQVTGYNPSNFTTERTMRPVENVSYTDIRQGQGSASSAAPATGGVYPADPDSGSFLGLLRNKTGIDFDLPSEAQWEFAARAGYGEGYWGDGSAMRIGSDNKDAAFDMLGRNQYNGGKIGADCSEDPPANCGVANGTAIVGSYLPNAWGLYDVYGNVWEWCLDYYAYDITALNGAVNTASVNGNRVAKGGSWGGSAPISRPAYCNAYCAPGGRVLNIGFRVACTAGLQ